jgi:hypothetical protein
MRSAGTGMTLAGNPGERRPVMPSVQPNKSTAESKNRAAKSRATNTGAQTQTGERDENYNLISVLYHALQGGETIGQYIQSTKANGDEELVEFFENTRQTYVQLAREARELLADRLESGQDESDDESDDEDE